jgi:hypothetical protein
MVLIKCALSDFDSRKLNTTCCAGLDIVGCLSNNVMRISKYVFGQSRDSRGNIFLL